MNKISSVKIAIVFVAVIAAVYFGYQLTAGRIIDSKKFSAIEPGRVTLLGIDAGGGYKIIVSNEIAQLVQGTPGKLETGQDAMGGGDDSAGDKRHIPLKETCQSLQGNTKALGELVTDMNDDLRKEREQIPPNPVIWQADDLKKAFKGDQVLEKKLEHDLNSKLDGTPSDFINVTAVFNGITVDLPVPVSVAVRGVPQTLMAHVRFPFRVGFTRTVETDLSNDNNVQLNPTDDSIRGYYLKEARLILDKQSPKENVTTELTNLISNAKVRVYAEAAEKVLARSQVILNENMISDASVSETGTYTNGQPLYNFDLELTGEGRDRLWQYSRHHVGTQLLLIVDGVAIAAPYVGHELEQSSVTITQMVDKSLVQQAIDDIKSAKSAPAASSADPKQ